MQNIKKPQGFTLVELLVVIVIIGILATGSVAMFTGAQQKARDSVRLTDIQAVKLAVEQYYGDEGEYPKANSGANALNDLEGAYIEKLPADPKSGETSSDSTFVYVYGSSDEATSHVQGQEFELSALFENEGNTKSKSEEDQGNDDFRWETGINISRVDTYVDESGAFVPTNVVNNDHMASGSGGDDVFIIDCNIAASDLSSTASCFKG